MVLQAIECLLRALLRHVSADPGWCAGIEWDGLWLVRARASQISRNAQPVAKSIVLLWGGSGQRLCIRLLWFLWLRQTHSLSLQSSPFQKASLRQVWSDSPQSPWLVQTHFCSLISFQGRHFKFSAALLLVWSFPSMSCLRNIFVGCNHLARNLPMTLRQTSLHLPVIALSLLATAVLYYDLSRDERIWHRGETRQFDHYPPSFAFLWPWSNYFL